MMNDKQRADYLKAQLDRYYDGDTIVGAYFDGDDIRWMLGEIDRLRWAGEMLANMVVKQAEAADTQLTTTRVRAADDATRESGAG